MRLITHNMLISNIKGVENGYPLKIQAENVEIRETEFDSEFVTNMLTKIEYAVLVEAANALGYEELPPASEATTSGSTDISAGGGGGGGVGSACVTSALLGDESFLRKVHHALLDLHLIDGQLLCPATSRPFPVKDGIPNMLLHEDEV
mmetsp:Transcript_55659/g.110333  ORF Transcript_55659/g.110333 Transcript_55659/m.110333 type:complete len:148 (+) Transcript_55659:31-474(+)